MRNELARFKTNYPVISAFLKSKNPESQLNDLKVLARTGHFRIHFPRLAELILGTRDGELTTNLFRDVESPASISRQDMKPELLRLVDEDTADEMLVTYGLVSRRLTLNDLVSDSGNLQDVSGAARSAAESLNELADTIDEESEDDPEETVVFSYGTGNDSFEVIAHNEDDFVELFVESIIERRDEGLAVPPWAASLSRSALEGVAVATYNNLRATEERRIRISDIPKKTGFGG